MKPQVPSVDIAVTRIGDFVFLSWAADKPAPVTPAEAETIALVLAGKTNREVAEARGVSVRTIANQVASAFRKLGVSSRLELKYRARASVAARAK